MGMYTQVRGWLCVGDVKFNDRKFSDALAMAKAESHSIEAVKDSTIYHVGWNGSAWLFIGAELKHYSDGTDPHGAEDWIKHLLAYFPLAEGRIDFQYEITERGHGSPYWEIYKGKITEKHGKTWTDGPGIGCRDDS